VIVVEGVRKSFRDLVVLDGVSLEVPDRSVVAMLGPSGIGKTVLIKIMAGLLPPDSGRVTYDGGRLEFGMFSDNHRKTGGIGYVFQSGALFDSLSVAENVALPLRETSRLTESQVAARVRQVLEYVGMEHNAGLAPRVLSGGMSRLVAIARALVTEPRYIFYDEPTTGLDPAVRERVCGLIKGLREGGRQTQVVVTHDLDAARDVADQLYMLKAGKLVRADSVRKEDYEQAYP
jgi:phospholipid/cholesterol/gamma-HCH transport system ATP-binding protein